MERITESMKVHEQWYKEAKQMTLDKLPEFIRKLSEDYAHNYGTICHALAAAGIATMCGMDKKAGITGFRAGCVMWEFIRHWNYESNKTGLRITDFDNMLYPQYEDSFDKTISPDTWKALQEEAQKKIDASNENHIKYLKEKEQYDKDLAEFLLKYPDYYERQEYYDHLSMGTGAEWDAYHEKEKSGFEFAPRKPFDMVAHQSVMLHWLNIVAGYVPFGYRVTKD